MTKLTWLHLSDWHQGKPSTNRKVVRNALIKDIKERITIDDKLRLVDFVVFSGDLACQGSAAEYEEARKDFLDPVLKAVNLVPDKLFIVPGNHDFNRNRYYKLPTQLALVLDKASDVDTWLTEDNDNRKLTLDPFAEYSKFVTGYTKQPTPDFASIVRLPLKDRKEIALLGINSAWMSARNKTPKGEIDDKSHLVVGERQILDALEEIADADVRIAVLHHPFEWLADFDRNRIESRLKEKCHFILRGHEHISDVQMMNGLNGECVIIPAAACYYDRDRINGYNWVNLDLEHGEGMVYMRRWSNRRGAWIEDNDACEKGEFLLKPLPKKLIFPISTPQPIYPPTFTPAPIYNTSDDSEFVHCLGRLAKEANKIIMIGNGLDCLIRLGIVNDIISRATDEQCTLEIYLGNPYSAMVQTRLIEENMRNALPPVGKTGLINRIIYLLGVWQAQQRPSNMCLRLFTNYPTFALINIDTHYFMYCYSYRELGNFSPVFYFSEQDESNRNIIEFFKEHYKRIKEDSVDAKMAQAVHDLDYGDFIADQGFAVFFIPEINSSLYEFGTEILGYDIRDVIPTQTQWSTQAGEASFFGLHMTICDALFFLTASERRKAIVETKDILSEHGPFTLSLKIATGFPDKKSIALLVEEPTGKLESIHSELVSHVYRRASFSYYSKNNSLANRDKQIDRSNHMIQRYHAPYILNAFRPHFTLLSNCSEQDSDSAFSSLKRIFNGKVQKEIRVEKIAIMRLNAENKHWEIDEEIKLTS